MTEPDAELLAWCRSNYDCVRVLPDGSIAALSRLMFTTGLFLGVTRWGYESRYCFESDAAASAALDAAQSQDDQPAGWKARRPERAEDIAAKLRPGYRGGDPADPANWEPGTP